MSTAPTHIYATLSREQDGWRLTTDFNSVIVAKANVSQADALDAIKQGGWEFSQNLTKGVQVRRARNYRG